MSDDELTPCGARPNLTGMDASDTGPGSAAGSTGPRAQRGLGPGLDAHAPGTAVSRWVDLDGPVHYLDFGGPADGPLLVGVHGLGGSSVNWLALAPLLVDRCRVLALDLAGFGLTRAAGRSTSVAANSDLTAAFVTEVGGGPAIWLGNSMGGLLTLLAASRRPQTVAGAVLVNPALMPRLSHRRNALTTAMFAAYLTPGVGKVVVAGRRRVRTPEQMATDTMRLCCGDPSRVDDAVVRAHVDLLERRASQPGVAEEFVEATRSLIATLARRRQVLALADAMSVPVLMLHGDRDRLVPLATAVELARQHPDWGFAVARGAGHVPQLEVPNWTAERIRSWLAGAGADAADAARPVSLSR